MMVAVAERHLTTATTLAAAVLLPRATPLLPHVRHAGCWLAGLLTCPAHCNRSVG